MKLLLTIVSLFVCGFCFAQQDWKAVTQQLDRALVSNDTVFLKQHLHPRLSYGHSNGWVETKDELLLHLFNGKLRYNAISSDVVYASEDYDVATLRFVSDIAYVLDGKAGKLRLHVLQTWVRTAVGWQLLSRQSTKVD